MSGYTAQMMWEPGLARVLAPDESWIAFVRREDTDTLLAHLNRPSGSPEGWPEGADAEGAELVPTSELYENPDHWQTWGTKVGWRPAYRGSWATTPSDVPVVARRKPKPVTRDVLAWDLEPEMKLERGGEVKSAERVRGRRVVVRFTSGASANCAHDSAIAVLVEEPNG